MLSIRKVKLRGGPWDGVDTMASHITARFGGHIYVWDGGEDTEQFVHAKTLLGQLSKGDYEREKAIMEKYVSGSPSAELPDIEEWRLNAWFQVLREGMNQ